MTVSISREQARRLLVCYHFAQTDMLGVLERLRTIQYDPLNPVGRNPDLVLQARVPGYQVDDWQKLAYSDRLAYDAWDKQACLVPVGDWPLRALIREKHRPYHDREILGNEAGSVADILAAIDARGPLSSLEFEKQAYAGSGHSWAGSTLAKRILRSLWACGLLVTHHRKSGRHYYDRPERVIPAEYFSAAPLVDEVAYYRWIMTQRYRATGLLRASAEACIWSSCGEAKERRLAIAQLVEAGVLTAVQIGEKKWPYYALTDTLKLLDTPLPAARVIFLAPLDSFMWDRKGILQLFDCDYLWEVYKPEKARKWGYYVLPVFYGDRFIARLDSRLERGTWTISRWWWEPDVSPDAEMLDALRTAMRAFLYYLRAGDIRVADGVDAAVRQAI
ncbi:MAG: winged helix-turn-helix domain-containing protein [Ktedonobacteraceae bacterium]|nr:winged helix-turn-helix domain-containing protein [Ktedonobacteraceae bacterium]